MQLPLLAFWLVFWLKLSLYLSPQWWVVAIAMIWVNAATTVKRLHDRNRSGWWAVPIFALNRLSYVYYGLFFGLSFGVDISVAEELLLVMLALALSLLQTWVFIELVFVIGTEGQNRYGPDPTRTVGGSPLHSGPRPYGVPDFLVRRAGPSPHNCVPGELSGFEPGRPGTTNRPDRPSSAVRRLRMDNSYTSNEFLFGFEGRINRAKYWYASLASQISCAVFLWILALVLGAIFGDHVKSIKFDLYLMFG